MVTAVLKKKNKLAILAISSTLFVATAQAVDVPPNDVAITTTGGDPDVNVLSTGRILIAGVPITVDAPGGQIILEPDNINFVAGGVGGVVRSTGNDAIDVTVNGGGSVIEIGKNASIVSDLGDAIDINAISITVLNSGEIVGKSNSGIQANNANNLVVTNNAGALIEDQGGLAADGAINIRDSIGVSITNDETATMKGGAGVFIGDNNSGTITNNGVMEAIGVSRGAIHINDSVNNFFIDNGETGVLQGTNGINNIAGGATNIDITNEGQINGDGDGIVIGNGTINTGNLTNQTTGVITGVDRGFILTSAAAEFNGNLLNEGKISGGISGLLLSVNANQFVGDITNSATGTIQSTGNASPAVSLATTFTGNFDNIGLIQNTDAANTSAVLEISINSAADFTNTGTIYNKGATATSYGVNIDDTITGKFDNQGIITTDGNAAGIFNHTAGTVTGGIFNSGTITSNGGLAVDIDVNTKFTQTAGTLNGGFESSGAESIFSGGTVNGAITLTGGIAQTLKIGNTTVTGAITGVAAQDQTLEITNNFTNAANITDFRNLDVSGGTFTINNPVSLSGDGNGNLDVRNGATIDLNSTLTGAPATKTTTATIAAGGTLNVNSTGQLLGAGVLNLDNNGTLYVNETGTVNITSIDNKAGVINIEITDNNNFSKITTSGGAGTSDVTGGTINVSLTGNGLVQAGAANAIPVITSGGNITGANNIVIGQPASQTLSFINLNAGAANNVSLVAVRVPFQAVGGTTNAINVGAALDLLVNDPNLNTDLQNAIAQIDILPTQQAVSDALESLAPDSSGALVELSQLTHLRNLETTVGRIDLARNLKDFIQTPIAGDEPYYGLGAWGKVFANSVSQKNQGEFAGYTASSIGFITGFDKNFIPEWTLGGAFAYTSGDAEGRSQFGNELDFNSLQFIGYSSYARGAWYLDSIFSAALNRYKTSRRIEIGTFRRTAKADFKAWQYSGKLESGYNLASGKYRIVPTVGLTYDMLDVDGYTESTAGGVSLSVEQRNVPELIGSFGIRFAALNEYVEALYVPEFRAFIHQDFIGDNLIKTANFASAGAVAFESRSAKPDPTTYNLGAAITAYTTNLIFSVNYDIEFRSQYIGHHGFFKIRYEW